MTDITQIPFRALPHRRQAMENPVTHKYALVGHSPDQEPYVVTSETENDLDLTGNINILTWDGMDATFFEVFKLREIDGAMGWIGEANSPRGYFVDNNIEPDFNFMKSMKAA